MQTNPETKPLVSPWQLLRDVCSWLPERDEQRALAIVEHHQRKATIAKLRQMMAKVTEELQRPHNAREAATTGREKARQLSLPNNRRE